MSAIPTNFFGLTVFPGKAYTTTLEDDVHITMAALTEKVPKDATRTTVQLTIDGSKFTLCSLTAGKLENQPLDIHLNENDEVTFTVSGNCPVDLTGTNIVIVPPGGADDMDEINEDDFDEEVDDEEIDSDLAEGGRKRN